MKIEAGTTWSDYRPGKEPYLAARLFELFPLVFGERGTFLMKLYAYMRWADDVVDECPDLSKKQKYDFLERQMGLVAGFEPENMVEMERVFSSLPWHCVPEKEVRHRINLSMGTILDDLDHQGLKPRSDREVRHYNWRSIRPLFDGLFLVVNGKPMGETRRVMEWLDAYVRIGSLEGLSDDLNQGVVKLPIMCDPGNEKDKLVTFCDSEWFDRTKWENLSKLAQNSFSFMELDIPLWQKAAWLVYVGQSVTKRSIFLQRDQVFKDGK